MKKKYDMEEGNKKQTAAAAMIIIHTTNGDLSIDESVYSALLEQRRLAQV